MEKSKYYLLAPARPWLNYALFGYFDTPGSRDNFLVLLESAAVEVEMRQGV